MRKLYYLVIVVVVVVATATATADPPPHKILLFGKEQDLLNATIPNWKAKALFHDALFCFVSDADMNIIGTRVVLPLVDS